jgi:hypothetical protein
MGCSTATKQQTFCKYAGAKRKNMYVFTEPCIYHAKADLRSAEDSAAEDINHLVTKAGHFADTFSTQPNTSVKT